MATSYEIQECIDSCTQSARELRSFANTVLCAMNRLTITLGAAKIEMCINTLVQSKTLTSREGR